MRTRLVPVLGAVLFGLCWLAAGVWIGIEVEHLACVKVFWDGMEPREGALVACR